MKLLRFRHNGIKVLKAISDDDIFILAGACSFYSFLSIVPFLSVFIGIYLLIAQDFSLTEIEVLKVLMPEKVLEILDSIIVNAKKNNTALSIGTIVSLIFSIWLANNLTESLAIALQRIFGLERRKTDLINQFQSVLYTFLLILSLIAFVFALTILPLILDVIDLGFFNLFLIYVGRWLLAAIYMVTLLTLIYTFLPKHAVKRRLRDYLPGAIFAAGLGGIVAILFSIYVINYGKYNQVYGALSTIVVFLIWLKLSFTSLLLGAKFNKLLFSRKYKRSQLDIANNIKFYLSHNPIRATFIILLVSLIILRISLPEVLKSELNNRIVKSAYEGRVQDINLNILSGVIELENADLIDKKNNLPNLQFSKLKIDFSWWGLLLGKFNSNIYIRDLHLDLTLKNDQTKLFNSFLELLELSENVFVPNLEITNAQVNVKNNEKEFKSEKINLIGKNISSEIQESKNSELYFIGLVENGEISFKGKINTGKEKKYEMQFVGKNVPGAQVEKLLQIPMKSDLIDFDINLFFMEDKIKGDIILSQNALADLHIAIDTSFYFADSNFFKNLENIFEKGIKTPILNELNTRR